MLKARDLYQQGKLKILHSSHAYRTGSSEATIIDKSIDKADEILLQVKAVFEKVLNIEQYSLTDSFLELGGDSLMGFELVSKIEERFHVKLDLREVLLDSSVSGVANYVRRTLAGAKGASKAVDLEQECNLMLPLRRQMLTQCSTGLQKYSADRCYRISGSSADPCDPDAISA